MHFDVLDLNTEELNFSSPAWNGAGPTHLPGEVHSQCGKWLVFLFCFLLSKSFNVVTTFAQ